MGIVFFANSKVETRDLVQEMGLTHFITNPNKPSPMSCCCASSPT